MSPRTKEQFETIRNNKESLILETALHLFAKNGFLSTPVSLIAKEAGISKGLLYNYYESKEDLLTTIIIGNLDVFLDFLSIKDPKNIQKKELVSFIEKNLEKLEKEPDFFKLYFSLAFQPSVFALLEQEIMQVYMPLVDTFTNYYTQKGKENAYVKARFLLAIFDGIGMHYVMDTHTFPLDETKKIIIDLI